MAVLLLQFHAILGDQSDVSDPPALWGGCGFPGFVEKLS